MFFPWKVIFISVIMLGESIWTFSSYTLLYIVKVIFVVNHLYLWWQYFTPYNFSTKFCFTDFGLLKSSASRGGRSKSICNSVLVICWLAVHSSATRWQHALPVGQVPALLHIWLSQSKYVKIAVFDCTSFQYY